MPLLSQHHASEITKALLIGDSGSGKTGALASLAKAGYNLRIVDFDNGVDVLFDLLYKDKAALDRVIYETCTDKFKYVGANPVPRSALAWSKAIGLLNHWKGDGYDLGPINTWTPQDVLVIDSATMAGNAAMRHMLSLNNKLAALPSWQDWQGPQTLLEQLFASLYSDDVKCNVIVISHLIQIGEEMTVLDPKGGGVRKETRPGSERAFPSTLGRALSPKVGRYFNACLLARSTPYGNTVKRKIFTDSQGIIELKNNAPTSVKLEYPIETGLADYFAAVRNRLGGGNPSNLAATTGPEKIAAAPATPSSSGSVPS